MHSRSNSSAFDEWITLAPARHTAVFALTVLGIVAIFLSIY
jgi:hypothetical protein